MAEFRKICDVYQGYNFKKDKQTAVGFITKLKLGDTELKADQACKNPAQPDEELKAVAVLSDALWETGVTDALYLSGQISVPNREEVKKLVLVGLINVEVLVQFTVFEYDPISKKYYKCFHSNDQDLKGLLEKRGEDLNVSAADDPSTEVQSPENYAFNIGVKPQQEAQTIHLAVSEKGNVVKSWGLKVG